MQKPIVFKSGNFEIYGVMHLPHNMSAENHVPAVVFCHGFTGTKVEAHRIFVTMARELEKKGIASLRFDFRGCGDSSGEFMHTTVLGEVEDTLHAIENVCSHHGIDKDRIGVLGLSLGGAVAAYAAGTDKRVKALALWAPAADLVEEAEQIRTENEIKSIRKLKAVDYYGTLLGRDFIKEIPKIKPVKALKNFNGVTLIVHGTEDNSVPLSHSLKYYNMLNKKGLKVDRHLIEGSDHVFSSYAWEKEVISKTLKFFVKNLQKT